MIEISNNDRDFIIRFIEEMNTKKTTSIKEYNLQRMANILYRKLKNKKSSPRK